MINYSVPNLDIFLAYDPNAKQTIYEDNELIIYEGWKNIKSDISDTDYDELIDSGWIENNTTLVY